MMLSSSCSSYFSSPGYLNGTGINAVSVRRKGVFVAAARGLMFVNGQEIHKTIP